MDCFSGDDLPQRLDEAVTQTLRIFIIAGEPSGDKLGAALMMGLKRVSEAPVEFVGIGGIQMQEQGLQSLFPMEELSIMGLVEILPQIPKMLKRITETSEKLNEFAPDAVVTIDSPDFCLRVARKARKAIPDLKTIHYVAPTVWAWRPGRAAKMAKVIDHVLALFPFEPPYMEAAGMTCDFVGHPIVEEPQASEEEAQAFRKRHGISANAPVLCVLPGSRGSEIGYLSPIFREVSEKLVASRLDIRIVIPTVPHLVERLREDFAGSSAAPIILDPTQLSSDQALAEKRACFAACDLALAASGTVSLELAAAGTPMVIAYRGNVLTEYLASRMALIDTVTLINVLTDTREVPEFLLSDCTVGNILPEVTKLLNDPALAEKQSQTGRRAIEMLGRGGEAPGILAARSVIRAIECT